MTPAARLAASAQILDTLKASREPVEAVLKAWGRANRYAGSKDRRAIADRVYRCIRARARLEWAMGEASGRALVLGSLSLIDGLELDEIAALFSGEGYGPEPLTPAEIARLSASAGDLPGWVQAGLPGFVADDLKATFGDEWHHEAVALMQPRAPIDLRVSTSRGDIATVMAELEAAGLAPRRTTLSATGLRLSAEPPPNVQAMQGFRSGAFEIQDEGSQIACWLAGGALSLGGAVVVDYCAGGGGKTLGLAQQMSGQGVLVACDVVPRRLDNIRPRLERAGVAADLRLLGKSGEGVDDLDGRADLVLVDAPCSGSGTWRRRPEEAWRLTEGEVERLHRLQTDILSRAARLVKPGGRLAYVTCSILSRENEASADAFAAAHPDFAPVAIEAAARSDLLSEAGRVQLAKLAGGSHRLRLSPHRTDTDGFFIALFERPA